MLQELSKDLFESYLHAELSCSFQNGWNVLFCPDDKSISIQTCYGRQWRMQSNNRVTSILGYNDDCRLSFASSVHHLSRCFKSLKQEIMWQSNILICDNQFFLSDFWRKKQWLGFCFDSDPKSRVVSCVCNLTKSSTDGKFNIQQIAKSHFLFLFTDWITEIGDRIINGCHWDGNYSLQNLDLFSPRHSVLFWLLLYILGVKYRCRPGPRKEMFEWSILILLTLTPVRLAQEDLGKILYNYTYTSLPFIFSKIVPH